MVGTDCTTHPPEVSSNARTLSEMGAHPLNGRKGNALPCRRHWVVMPFRSALGAHVMGAFRLLVPVWGRHDEPGWSRPGVASWNMERAGTVIGMTTSAHGHSRLAWDSSTVWYGRIMREGEGFEGQFRYRWVVCKLPLCCPFGSANCSVSFSFGGHQGCR